MRTYFYLLTIACLFLLSCQQSKEEAWEIKIDKMVERYTIDEGPGGVIGVFKGTEPLYVRAFGYANVETKDLNTPETLFDIASCAKQFTASAIIEMSNRGMIDLEEPIQKYFPEFAIKEAIPIRSLLTHSSGISDYSEMLLLSRGRSEVSSFSKSEVLKTIYDQTSLSFEPLHDDNYSNSNYVILAELVERVSQESFEVFVEKYVLNDLKLIPGEILFQGAKIADSVAIATGYPLRKAGETKFIPSDRTKNPAWKKEANDALLGASGMQANVYGLAKWMGSLKELKSGGKPLIRQLMVKDTLKNGNLTEYSRGIQLGNVPEGFTWIEHTGRNNFTSVMLWWPDLDISMIALMNTQEIWAQDLTNEICMDIIHSFPAPDQLFNEVVEEKATPNAQVTNPYIGLKVKIELEDHELKKFTGVYPADAPVGHRPPPSGGVGVNKIVYDEGKLKGIRYDGLSINLLPISNSVLALEGVPIEFHFVDLDSDYPGFFTVEEGSGKSQQVARKLEPISFQEKAIYVGTYESTTLPNSIPIEIDLVDDKLYMQWGALKHRTELYPIDTNRLTTYLNKDGIGMQCNLVIQKSEEGMITGFKYDGHRVWNLEFSRN